MKKICLAALAALVLLVGCAESTPTTQQPTEAPVSEPEHVKLCLPDGAPMMAVTNLLAEGLTVGEKQVSFEIELVQAANIASVFAAEGADLAIMPTVSAAQLYARGEAVRFLSANVFGNLYVVGAGEAQTLSDLVGKVVYTTTGTTIALLEYELAASGISFVEGSEAQANAVTLYSMNAASDYLPLLVQAAVKGGEAYGVLGEPAVTKCLETMAEKTDAVPAVLDLQEEYRALTGNDGYPQASLIGSASFVTEYAPFVRTLLTLLEGNAAYAEAHASELQALYGAHGSTALTGIAYTAETVARCHLGILKGSSAREAVEAYLTGLSAYVPPLKGLDLEGFYFDAE